MVEIHTEVKGDKLFITASGEAHTLEERLDVIKRYYQLAVEHNIQKVLIKQNQVSKPNQFFDQLELVKRLDNTREFPKLRKFRIAVVGTKKELSDENFLNLFLSNRGIKIKYFSEPEKADEWLEVSKSSISMS